MKIIWRVLYGFLVAYVGLYMYLLSNYDMQTKYLVKYGDQAVETGDTTFFKSLYDHYSLTDVTNATVDDGTNYAYFYAFVGTTQGVNHLRLQVDNLTNFDISNGLVVTLNLADGQTVDIALNHLSETWYFNSVDLKALVENQETYITIDSLVVTAKGETDVVIAETNGTNLLPAEAMDLAALETANENDDTALEALGYGAGVTHNYFSEYQWVLWRNTAFFIVFVGGITYLLFFKKKSVHYRPNNNPITRPHENVNLKSMDENTVVDVKPEDIESK